VKRYQHGLAGFKPSKRLIIHFLEFKVLDSIFNLRSKWDEPQLKKKPFYDKVLGARNPVKYKIVWHDSCSP
jgi:hypothetical protein